MTTGRRLGPRPHLISLSNSALTLAARYTRENLPREVGGILVGWREERTVVVHDVLLIADTFATGNRYDRRHQPADQQLRDYLDRANDRRLGYVGEWHSHREPQPPSLTDLRAVRAIARNLNTPVALVVLMSHRNGQSIEPTGRIAGRIKANRTRLYTAHISTH